MGLISVYHTWVDGKIPNGLITADRLNTNLSRLYDLVNGNIDEDNIENPCKIMITSRDYNTGNYKITGAWEHDGTVQFDGAITANSTVTLNGALTATSTAELQGTTTISGALSCTNTVSISNTLEVTGTVSIKDTNELRFYDNGNYVGFEAPALSADQIWVLPSADGDANQLLKTDGAGNLSWVNATVFTCNWTKTGDHLYYNSGQVMVGGNSPDGTYDFSVDSTKSVMFDIADMTTSQYIYFKGACAGGDPEKLFGIKLIDDNNSVTWTIEMNSAGTGLKVKTNNYTHMQFYESGTVTVLNTYVDYITLSTSGDVPGSMGANTIGMYAKDISSNDAAPHFMTEDDKELKLYQQAHIADADGQLADITTKFNTLLGYLENLGLIATS